MTKTEKTLGVAILIAIVIAIGAYLYPKSAKFQAGSTYSTTNYPSLAAAFLSLGAGCDDGFSNSCPQRQTTRRVTFTTSAGTTTLCSIKNPFSATSTIKMASIELTTATSAAMYLRMGTSTGADMLTTSNLFSMGVASSTLADYVYYGQTSTKVADNPTGLTILGPNDYFTVGLVASSSSATYLWQNIVAGSSTTTPAGACNVEIQTIN